MEENKLQSEMIKELYAELYDQHQTHTDDVEFILDLIGKQSKRVLEVGCGSGRILIPLAMSGHDTTGFDIDDSMSNIIPGKIAAELKNIRWHRADAVRDKWSVGFDVVILAGNILFNIEGMSSGAEYKKAQELFIQKAATALSPGGYVYIDYSPYASNGRTLVRQGQSCEDDGKICWSWEGTDAAGNFEKDTITSGSFDEETGILKFKRFREQRLIDGRVIKDESQKVKHYATLEQIHGWLANAGFIVELECENFARKPIDDDSRNVIIYAKKRSDS